MFAFPSFPASSGVLSPGLAEGRGRFGKAMMPTLTQLAKRGQVPGVYTMSTEMSANGALIDMVSTRQVS